MFDNNCIHYYIRSSCLFCPFSYHFPYTLFMHIFLNKFYLNISTPFRIPKLVKQIANSSAVWSMNGSSCCYSGLVHHTAQMALLRKFTLWQGLWKASLLLYPNAKWMCAARYTHMRYLMLDVCIYACNENKFNVSNWFRNKCLMYNVHALQRFSVDCEFLKIVFDLILLQRMKSFTHHRMPTILWDHLKSK